MSTSPLVTVTVAVYNSAHVVAETIESVLAQTYRNIELIIVDDASKDGSAEVIQRYTDPRIVFVRNEVNQRLAAGRNEGLRRAKGEYVAWIDHDDVWMPEKLALQVAYMERHPQCVVVATDFSAFDADGFYERSHAAGYYSRVAERGLARIFSRCELFATKDVPFLPDGVPETLAVWSGRVFDELVFGNCLHPPTVLMRRSATVEAGFCEQRFGNDVDYEYLVRLSRLGEAAFIDHPLIRYRYSEGQLSSDKNMKVIKLSLVTVLDELARRHPELAAKPAFRQRMAAAHLGLADTLAEARRIDALRHLVSSLRTAGVVDARRTAVTLAKMMLPRRAIARYRARRHRG
jgi:glycosyltransferase involved in cell wall biosynthesis